MAKRFAVSILDVAIEDIVERVEFTRSKWGEAAAEIFYLELMKKLELLATQPRLGHVPLELSRLGISSFRVLVHELHTKILYELNINTETINIHMVFGSNQDFQTLLYKRIMRAP
jgi:plasmid stabilization system protein ParE